jgi:UDP-N-acetylmuramyl tripeptide synthase
MQFSNKQIQLLNDLQIYDEVMAIVETNLGDIKQQVLSIIATTKKVLQEKTYKIIQKEEFLNPYKLTTIDPIELQKSLNTMVQNGCKIALVEISSQGLEQNRHWGLGKFDGVGFLNLYPEHIDSHGSFENYKKCKIKLFQAVKQNGIAIVNGDDQNSDDFLSVLPHGVSQIILGKDKDFVINKYSPTIYKNFEIKNLIDYSTMVNVNSHLMADFEVYNVMIGARLIEKFLRVNCDCEFDFEILNGQYFGIPGRLEWVVQDNKIVFSSL